MIMRKYLFTLLALFALTTTAVQATPKHRHDPAKVGTVGKKGADPSTINAYSDTTSRGANASEDDDSDDYASNYNPPDFDDDSTPSWSSMWKEKMASDKYNPFAAPLFIIFLILASLAPFILIGFIAYWMIKGRNQKYKLAEKAIESGQTLPQEFLHTDRQTDEYLWKRGIKNGALGVGLAIMFLCLGAEELAGIGGLIFFYGVGQALIARTSARKWNRHDDTSTPDNL